VRQGKATGGGVRDLIAVREERLKLAAAAGGCRRQTTQHATPISHTGEGNRISQPGPPGPRAGLPASQPARAGAPEQAAIGIHQACQLLCAVPRQPGQCQLLLSHLQAARDGGQAGKRWSQPRQLKAQPTRQAGRQTQTG
jgi:hypothetical protein